MKWSGDVDLNDGTLQQSYKDYLSKLKFFAGLGIATRQCSLKEDLVAIHEQLLCDKEFIIQGKY